MAAPTIATSAASFHDTAQKVALINLFNALYDRMSSQSLTSAGLVIGTVSKKVPKTGANWVGVANGVLVYKASGTAMPALSGTVAATQFNVFAFFVDSAGTVTSAMGTAGATLDLVVFPPLPAGKALLGFITVNPTTAQTFTGGSTDLDDVTVIPATKYYNVVGAFDPTMTI